MNELVRTLPSEDLRWRVAGHRDAKLFWDTGRMTVADIVKMLAIDGKSFGDFPRALEFGCGCGRILMHMEAIAEKSKLYGIDIDSESVAWVQQHVPWVEASVNAGLPPTKFEDGFFDLVFNQSVFSHLDERYQDAWLAELARITRPGGRVVVSVSGIDPFMELVKTWRNAKVDPTHVMADFRRKGFLFVEDDGWVDGPFPDFYHSTFHAPWYVFDHWSAFFAIKAYVPRGSLDFMDYILLERRAGPSPAVQPLWESRVPTSTALPSLRKPSIARRIARRVRKYVRGTPKPKLGG